MATRPLAQDDKGPAVKAFQAALNRRAESRFYPPLALDSDFGPATRRAFEALGWALGLGRNVLARREISPRVQELFERPGTRTPEQLERARQRAPRLHLRTIGLDGGPIFWGLAKPLVRARERGWGGRLTSGDRRKGVPERFGKKSQATLFACFKRSQAMGRCPVECGGDCRPANPPGFSSHELRSDGSQGFPGKPRGAKLEWFKLGMDLDDSDGALEHLRALGYKVHRTYPNSLTEHHHLNFTASPGPVVPPVGPNAAPATMPTLAAVPAGATGRLRGIDVSLNQPSIDWPKVAASGRAFAYAKVSDGLGTPDPKFTKARWSRMREAGLARGAYHFGRPQPNRDPRDEVREFLRLLDRAGGLRDGDLIPMLDLEAFGLSGTLRPRQTLEWTRGFVNEMRAQIGRRPIIYTGAFWRDQMGNPADDLGCRLWLAAFVKRPNQFLPAAWVDSGWTIWQHTDKGRVPGVEGALCDLDRLKGGSAGLERLRM
jgi:lysozyme